MTDQATESPTKIDTATKLAYQRTRLAQDNAVLAWIRTATSLITFGFTVYKFFQIELQGRDRTAQLLGPRGFGLTMISLGLLSILLGTLEHHRAMKELQAQYPDMPRSTAGMLAALMAGLGIVALIVVIFRGMIAFAVLMDAVRRRSLGRITDTLYEVGGNYRRNMTRPAQAMEGI